MFLPTPRNSCTTGTPIRPRCSGSPTPDNCRMCGEPTAPAAREFDAGRALAVEQDAMHQRVRDELEVGALQSRVQVGARGAGAATAAAGLLAPANAVVMTRGQV